MSRQYSTIVNAPATVLFDLSQDYANRLAWDPFLKGAELLDGATKPGLGIRTLCTAKSGLAMESRYVSFNPPRACAVEMIRGPWFLSSFASSWRFDELPGGQTRASFRFHLQAKPRLFSWITTPIASWVFYRHTRRRVEAMKRVAEKMANAT